MSIRSAHNPDIFGTRSPNRPLSNREQMQRMKAVCASANDPHKVRCTGVIFASIFFDGTGNNEKNDYNSGKLPPEKWQHSNVARLFHAFPFDKKMGSTGYYRYYIPGVGTKFPEINDEGGTAGKAFAWNGESRIIWGLTRVFNAVNMYVNSDDLIPAKVAGAIANATGGLGSLGIHRRFVFKNYWHDKLKQAINVLGKPQVTLLNLSVFGFSRGAAQARAFVNWFYEICDEVDGGWTFAGIPVRLQFLGLFDTVASVGVAGLFTIVEGRQSWANANMQVHSGVENCLHMVAAHEVRGCFPADSVRVGEAYPNNCKEYVYPGAHSDVGGGYSIAAQGKTNELARVPGFEMYCAALAAGVPFKPYSTLNLETAECLRPKQESVDWLKAYIKAAQITGGPVETMHEQHMAHYFTYRWKNAGGEYLRKPFYLRADKVDRETLNATQTNFEDTLQGLDVALRHAVGSRAEVMDYPEIFRGSLSGGTVASVKANANAWTARVNAAGNAVLLNTDSPERDPVRLIGTLSEGLQSAALPTFFDNFVHDSMAGFIKDSMNEYAHNNIGLAKFRRIYFGNQADKMLMQAAAAENTRRTHDAKSALVQQLPSFTPGDISEALKMSPI